MNFSDYRLLRNITKRSELDNLKYYLTLSRKYILTHSLNKAHKMKA